MRIVAIFLVLILVSVAGVGVLMNNIQKAGLPSLGLSAGAAQAEPASKGSTESASGGQPQSQPAAPAPAAPTLAAGEAVSFSINSGDTTGVIAERLARMGMVPNAMLFRFWVQWRGAEGRLQAGEYQLRQGMSMDELVQTLQTAKAQDVAITFIEGRRLEEYAEAVQKADIGIDAARFLELARRGNVTYDFLESKPTGATLEGYLFPDTYRVIPGKTTADELLHMMLKRFGENVTPQMREQARAAGLNVHQLVTLASIVEREAQVKDERPLIAAVYLNRLKIREPLGADATVQYAIGKEGDWWPQLRDLARNIAPTSPYNSYTNAGLPPAPISSAGASALRAVTEPAKVDYLFYVRDDVKNDGSHRFARTLAEHEANIARYQRR